MPSKARDLKKFQLNFLQFLSEKNVADVHIYHHVMNYWSNDSSMVSLQSLKEAITDLSEKNSSSQGTKGIYCSAPREFLKKNKRTMQSAASKGMGSLI